MSTPNLAELKAHVDKLKMLLDDPDDIRESGPPDAVTRRNILKTAHGTKMLFRSIKRDILEEVIL